MHNHSAGMRPQTLINMWHLKRTNSTSVDFQQLITLLDKDLAIRDGDEHAFYAQFNKIVMIQHAIVAYSNKQPIACGAFKEFDATTIEIKRMFVLPSHRGQGIAGKVLMELEQWASEINYQYFILETGKKQPEAIALYQKMGYLIIPNYGQYEHVENSVCMKKAAKPAL